MEDGRVPPPLCMNDLYRGFPQNLFLYNLIKGPPARFFVCILTSKPEKDCILTPCLKNVNFDPKTSPKKTQKTLCPITTNPKDPLIKGFWRLFLHHYTAKNPEKKSVLFSKMSIFFSNWRIIRRFEGKKCSFWEKDPHSREKDRFFFLTFFCSGGLLNLLSFLLSIFSIKFHLDKVRKWRHTLGKIIGKSLWIFLYFSQNFETICIFRKILILREKKIPWFSHFNQKIQILRKIEILSQHFLMIFPAEMTSYLV